ncbi:hypothetical protein EYF80_064958 [Liparis tanakae]|uniref:Uncharacterized protein n=1 Tax=Liparis tanakae TaxID=230148 RepID=A0A4Z2E7Z1_9TELE|nr:hypothetical protein EYF80_064958 [Liparis tanakae]
MCKELPHVVLLVPQRSGHHRLHRRGRLLQPVHHLLPAGGLDRRVPGHVQGHQVLRQGNATLHPIA